MLAKHPAWHPGAERVFHMLQRHQNLLILSFRFLYGLRTVTPFAIGMSDVSYLRFTLLNIIGAASWAMGIALAGYYFGQAVEAVLGDIKRYEIELMSIIAFASLLWVMHLYRRRKSA